MSKTIALLTDSHKVPNIALMKIATYHKMQGDSVDWFVPLFAHTYDKVYYSKIFSFSRLMDEYYLSGNIETGGTGIDISKRLPDEIDVLPCDYSIYPSYKYAVGFVTRGCIRSCSGCVVPQKEGSIYEYRKIEDIARPDSNKVVLLDNNILASEFGQIEIEKLTTSKYYVDFNQGVDARLITPEIARLLANVKYMRYLRLACDSSDMLPIIENAIELLRSAGYKRELFCYTLAKDFEESYQRIMKLDAMNVTPFAQPYVDISKKSKDSPRILKELARWVNRRFLFKSCSFDEYQSRKKSKNINEEYKYE